MTLISIITIAVIFGIVLLIRKSQNHVNNYGLRGFAAGFVVMFVLTFRSCKNGFTGTWGTDYFFLVILSLLFGILFGALGLVLGKNIKSSRPINDYSKIREFLKSVLGKVILFCLLIFIISLYFFGRQKNPFSNGTCVKDLRNNIECINFLQGKWSYKKGSQYNYVRYYVEVVDNKILFKSKNSENQNWVIIKEGEIGFEENVESYWCCTRSVRAITINGESTFLYMTQSEKYNDNCGGFAFDGYTGKDIVGDEDFFQRTN